MRLVYGFGINDRPDLYFDKVYKLWSNMLRRAFSEKHHITHPYYKDCTVAEEFRRFSDFYNWCQNQVGFGRDGYDLDKDLLVKGNKEYHPDKCVFLPKKLNILLIKAKKSRGKLPIGVSSHNKTGFIALLSCNGKRKHLGRFRDPIDAFNTYKFAKENLIKEFAKIYKHDIDPRAYETLMNYTVEITD